MVHSASHYQNMLQMAPCGYAEHQIVFDESQHPVDYIFLEVNTAFEEITGLHRKDIIGKRVTAVLPEITRDPFDWIARYGRIVASGKAESFESFSRPLSSHYNVLALPVSDSRFVTFCTLVDETMKQFYEYQKNLQHQIQKTEKELDRFFSISMDLLCIASIQGRFIRINESWKEVLGYTSDDLKGQLVLDFIHPEDLASTREILSLLESGREVRNFVNRYRAKDGTYQYLEWRARPHGSMIYAAARDVTEKIRKEEALKKSEARYRGVLNSQLDLIVRVTPDNLLTYVNDAYCHKFGKDRESLIGNKFLPLVHPEDQESTMKAMEGLAVPPHRIYVEQRAMTVDGWRWLAWEDYAILDDQGNIQEIQGVGRDITESKENEQQLIKSLAEKDVMLKEIHHRVKNNLQIISSLLYLQGAASENEVIVKALQNSQSRVEAMALLHEKIYNASDLSRVDLLDYLENLGRQIHEFYADSGAAVSFKVLGESLCLNIEKTIVCGLIFNELMANALQHAFVGISEGAVTLSVEKVSEDTVQLTVTDNGIGFPDSLCLDTVETLGLQLVRNLSQQMEGSLEVIRSPQTRFQIQFPI